MAMEDGGTGGAGGFGKKPPYEELLSGGLGSFGKAVQTSGNPKVNAAWEAGSHAGDDFKAANAAQTAKETTDMLSDPSVEAAVKGETYTPAPSMQQAAPGLGAPPAGPGVQPSKPMGGFRSLMQKPGSFQA